MASVSTSQWQIAQEHEREFWESYARTYVRFPQILLDHLAKLRAVGEYVTEELAAADIGQTLEVGVGPLGIGVLGVHGCGGHITAVDPLARVELEMQDDALEQYVRALRDRVDYRCTQGESLPFDEDSYDFVCCHNVIDHAHEPVSILSEIYRVLKPGRRFFLTLNTFSLLGRFKFETLRRLHPNKPIFVCHPHAFLHAEVIDHLAVIGFEIVRHDGGRDAVAGRGRLSKFLCRKPEAVGQGRSGSRTTS